MIGFRIRINLIGSHASVLFSSGILNFEVPMVLALKTRKWYDPYHLRERHAMLVISMAVPSSARTTGQRLQHFTGGGADFKVGGAPRPSCSVQTRSGLYSRLFHEISCCLRQARSATTSQRRYPLSAEFGVMCAAVGSSEGKATTTDGAFTSQLAAGPLPRGKLHPMVPLGYCCGQHFRL